MLGRLRVFRRCRGRWLVAALRIGSGRCPCEEPGQPRKGYQRDAAARDEAAPLLRGRQVQLQLRHRQDGGRGGLRRRGQGISSGRSGSGVRRSCEGRRRCRGGGLWRGVMRSRPALVLHMLPPPAPRGGPEDAAELAGASLGVVDQGEGADGCPDSPAAGGVLLHLQAEAVVHSRQVWAPPRRLPRHRAAPRGLPRKAGPLDAAPTPDLRPVLVHGAAVHVHGRERRRRRVRHARCLRGGRDEPRAEPRDPHSQPDSAPRRDVALPPQLAAASDRLAQQSALDLGPLCRRPQLRHIFHTSRCRHGCQRGRPSSCRHRPRRRGVTEVEPAAGTGAARRRRLQRWRLREGRAV